MKNYTAFLFLLLLLATTACQEPKDACCVKPATAGAAGTKSAFDPATVSDISLYNLESDWQDQTGKERQLSQFGGKIQLVSMIYTSCGYACPRLVADLKRIENSLIEFKREDVGIMLVTMDPARDTPENLQKFARDNKLDPSRWTLLTSSQDNIRELAALLNMKYKTELDGEISHSNIISVLNPNGEIIHQQEGLGVDPDETVKSIKGQLL
ncbi:MAG TPA: SCO family protein [Adhaeribacter sp.]|nr:SCO family protein [Adhaeribacter sp.]